MIIDFVRALIVIGLGIFFAYVYGYIEHGFIPPAEHLRLVLLNHFAIYHVIMFGLFSALPIVVLVFEPNRWGLLLAFGLFVYLPLGEDVAWYHFAGTWPDSDDWTSWGGGYYIGKKWVPRWYLFNSAVSILLMGLALHFALAFA